MSYKLAGVIWNDDGTIEIKKLSALEASEELRKYWNNDIPLSASQGLNIVSVIETALKEGESYKEAYFELKKAFAIVEKYKVNIYDFRIAVRSPNDEFTYIEYSKYYECFSKRLMIERDFDFLKEVFS